MAEVRATRTLPPWIESHSPRLGSSPEEPQRPASAAQPQHNSHPSDPQRRTGPPRVSHSSGSNSRNSRLSRASGSIGTWRRDQLLRQQSPDGYADSSQEKLPLKKRRPRNLHQLFSGKGPSRWDHLRSADPVIVPTRAPQSQQSWRDFVVSSSYGHNNPNEQSMIVADDVLDQLQPGPNDPVELPGSAGADCGRTGETGGKYGKLRRLRRRPPPFLERLLLAPVRHPLGPLFCRLTVLSTSVIALSLAATMVQRSLPADREHEGSGNSKERGQAIFAVAVDTVAIPYIGYIMWDENFGPPLMGVQRTKQRVRLILMDLFFIMFKAASTGLAFETLIYTDLRTVRQLLEALAAFELVGLVTWAMTLIANVFRVVERLGGRGDSLEEKDKEKRAGNGYLWTARP